MGVPADLRTSCRQRLCEHYRTNLREDSPAVLVSPLLERLSHLFIIYFALRTNHLHPVFTKPQ